MTTPQPEHWIPPHRFYDDPVRFQMRVDRKTLKKILLENVEPLCNGHLWEVQYNHIGLGVYDLWFTKKDYSKEEEEEA